MKTEGFLLLVIASLVLTGCATSYHPNGITGGYEDAHNLDDTFTVRFYGNGYTTEQRAKDLAMLRAAELTITNGFKYFQIINSDAYSAHSSFTTPAHENTTTFYNANGYDSYTTYTPPQTYDQYRPRAFLTIKMFNEKQPNDSKLYYDAILLKTSLKEEYRIK